MPTLVRSALGLTILVHAVMHAGQVGLEVWVPPSAVKTDIKEDELVQKTFSASKIRVVRKEIQLYRHRTLGVRR